MKKYLYIGIVCLGSMMASCENFLDRQPLSDLSVDTYWQSENDLKTWTAGMYDGLQSTLRQNWFYWGELRGGTYAPRGTNYNTNMLYNGLSSTDTGTSWSSIYSTIYRANSAIKHIPETPLSETVYADYLAQAYVMRALMYFYAIRVWGEVPMVTEPYEDVSTQEKYYGRNSLLELKELMLGDIERAMTLFGLSTNMSSASKYYLNKGAALALKVDILVWYKEYDNAIEAANTLIKDYGYSLTTGNAYKAQFLDPSTSPEMIFNLYWDYAEDGNAFGYASFIASGSNTISYHPTKKYFNELVGRKYENDSRINLVLDTLYVASIIKDYSDYNITEETYDKFYEDDYGAATSFQVKCPKFCETSVTANDGYGGYAYDVNGECNTRMPIYRLADIMLLKAEALVLCSKPDLQGAIDIVNQIRERAGWTNKATLAEYDTKDKVLNLIIDERTIEFWAEGKHWFDLVRNDKVKEYLDEYMADYDSESFGEIGFDIGAERPANLIGGYGRILWPLNQDVFRKNPNMSGKQNPPYAE